VIAYHVDDWMDWVHRTVPASSGFYHRNDALSAPLDSKR
jgi:hypothetical protein